MNLKTKNFYFWLILFLGAVFLIFPKSSGALSVRSIGMGQAFTGLADDPSAVWWNPAGLAYQKQPDMIYSRLLGERESFAPDDFAAVAIPISEIKDTVLGVGLYSDQLLSTITYQGSSYLGLVTNRMALISIAQALFPEFSVGATLKFHQRIKSFMQASQEISGQAQLTEYDFGFLWKISQNFDLGLIVQNANAPEFTLLGAKEPVFANVRPGLVWRLQPNIKITFDLDDAFGETDGKAENIAQNFNLGSEFQFYGGGYLRAGLLHFNSSVSAQRLATIGFGVSEGSFTLDAAIVYPFSQSELTKHLYILVGAGYKI